MVEFKGQPFPKVEKRAESTGQLGLGIEPNYSSTGRLVALAPVGPVEV